MRYESKVTWREEKHPLHCSSLFHGAPRHDVALVLYGDRHIFCQLVFTFIFKFKGVSIALALVQPLNAPLQLNATMRQIDRDLGLCRVRERSRKESLVIPLRSIVRGALVVNDSSRSGERLVIDALDGDMILRCAEIFPNRLMAVQERWWGAR